MKIISQIPNVITLGNLFCGFAAIVFAFNGQVRIAMALILFGATLDFFDGLSARVLNVKSAIGAQLDSLSDLVTFGIAPAVILYVWFDWITEYKLAQDSIEYFKSVSLVHESNKNVYSNTMRVTELFGPGSINLKALIISSLIPIAGAIRLAKFNVNGDNGGVFRGMAIPIAGIFLASFPVICVQMYHDQDLCALKIITNKYLISAVVMFISGMMISNFPMFSFKMKSFSVKEYPFQFILIACIMLAIIVGLLIKNIWISIPIIVVLYILLSLVKNLLKR